MLETILRLLQPIMPFVTDTLWHEFGYGPRGELMGAKWPVPVTVPGAEAAVEEIDWLTRFISEIRTVRSEMNVPPSRLSPVLLKDASATTQDRATRWRETIGRMARVSEIGVLDGDVPKGSAQAVLDEATLVLPLADIIDLDAERARLSKELDKAESEIEKTERKLGNADFIARGKPEVVEETRERLVTQQGDRDRLKAALARLG